MQDSKFNKVLATFTKKLIIDTILIPAINCIDEKKSNSFDIYTLVPKERVQSIDETTYESIEMLLNVMLKHKEAYHIVFKNKREYLAFNKPEFTNNIDNENFIRHKMLIFKEHYNAMTDESQSRFQIIRTYFSSDIHELN
ncbi:MAG: hypothetical protein L3J10_10490 [Sulfurimonas sp.]|nr:hypothetical protein [Sulfurimonas sp.]